MAFETLEARLLLAADFGDAPAPYATLLADDGPRHEAVGPMLGLSRDAEADGAPSFSADGDGADDDGVLFGATHIGQLGASVQVTASNAPAGAKLDAWIDFDGDGSFGAAGERIAAGLTVVEGVNTLTFDVPAWAKAGATFARFRLSSSGVAAPTGAAVDGEVEDYAVSINSPEGAGKFGYEAPIDSANGSTHALALADLDRDGDLDIVASSHTEVVWYANEGTGSFTRRSLNTLAEVVTDVAVADLDGDGDLDLLSTSGGEVAWHENDGSQSFAVHTIELLGQQIWAPLAADLDGDGDLDVAAAGPTAGVRWYANDGVGGFMAQPLVAASANWVDAADIDGDGDLDLVSGATSSLAWHENSGDGVFTPHAISATALNFAGVRPADIDRDGDVDLFAPGQSTGQLSWFENDGSQSFAQRPIGFSPGTVNGAVLADFDGDGDWDVLAAFSNGSSITWYENNGTHFVSHELTERFTGRLPLEVAAGDLDGDGDLDVVAGQSAGSNRVAWFENVANSVSIAAGASSVVEDAGAPATITFTRDGDVSQPLTVYFSRSGTADTLDFTASDGTIPPGGSSGSVTFAAGESTAQVVITPSADSLIENDETIVITLRAGFEYHVPEEDVHTVTIVDDEPVDFGDLPAPFATRRTFGGAGHGAAGPQLGAARDAESNGYPSAAADADDTGADDEDGVVFGLLRPGIAGATATVTVQNAPSGAWLSAWIDFDGDGNFSAAGEQVAHALPVQNGENTVRFDIPAGARVGQTYARFRISTLPGMRPGGLMADGEVEDYQVEIAAPAATATFVFSRQVGLAVLAEAVDFDRDGDIDVVAQREASGPIVRYMDFGTGYESVNLYNAFTKARALAPMDFDQDGDVDLVLSHENSWSGLQWLENRGSFFRIHNVWAGLPNLYSAPIVVNMDEDLDLDVVAGASVSDVAWYESNGLSSGFALRQIDGSTPPIAYVDAADLDRDGDIDVVSSADSWLAWHENNGGGNFTRWHLPGSTHFKRGVQIADMDGDGQLDIVVSHNGYFSWYKRTGGFFEENRIVAPAGFYTSFDVADFDGDGDPDIVAADSPGIMLFTNNGGEFTARKIVDTTTTSVRAADMDQDGDLDVLAVGNGVAKWWENIAATDGDADDDGDVDGRDLLAWQRSLGATVATGAGADANGDGAVNQSDLAVWRANFGYPGDAAPGELALASGLELQRYEGSPFGAIVSIDAYLASDMFAALGASEALSDRSAPRPRAAGDVHPVGIQPGAPLNNVATTARRDDSSANDVRVENDTHALDEAFNRLELGGGLENAALGLARRGWRF